MPKNIAEIPYTEIFERVVELGRVSPNAYPKVRGVIQDMYLRDITIKHDWNFLFVDSSLTTTAEYKVGTVTINTGATAATFSTDVSLTGAFTGRKIKFSGNDAVYDFTFSNTTGGTITPALQGPNNLSGVSYDIFQPLYALAGDFGRFPKEGGLYKWAGGKKSLIPEESFQEYVQEYQSTPSIPNRVRLNGTDTAGNQLIEFRPAPKDARVYGYTYIRKVGPMIETTAGLIKGISSNATTVDGLNSARFLEAQTGDWFRIDALGKSQDSTWYKIIAIADNSSLTLATAFANTAITSSASFTISRAPEMPYLMHPAIIWGALEEMSTDQSDPAMQVYHAKYAQTLSDSKRLYVSRVYNQKVETIAEDYRYRR